MGPASCHRGSSPHALPVKNLGKMQLKVLPLPARSLPRTPPQGLFGQQVA